MKIKPTPTPGRVVMEVDGRDESLIQAGQKGSFAVRKVLVPVDFSDCSKKALHYALPLAKQFEASLHLVYVMPVNYFIGSEFGPVDFPVPESEWRENSRAELEKLAVREIGSTVPWTAEICQGQPAHEITSYASRQGTDLIVISTHGRTGLRHVLLGSVAENVVRHAPCPVLVVREAEVVSAPEGREEGGPQG